MQNQDDVLFISNVPIFTIHWNQTFRDKFIETNILLQIDTLETIRC